eukprot:COSAG01_NODE_8925_length_2612_cov_2.498209_1_plen_132_part_10
MVFGANLRTYPPYRGAASEGADSEGQLPSPAHGSTLSGDFKSPRSAFIALRYVTMSFGRLRTPSPPSWLLRVLVCLFGRTIGSLCNGRRRRTDGLLMPASAAMERAVPHLTPATSALWPVDRGGRGSWTEWI